VVVRFVAPSRDDGAEFGDESAAVASHVGRVSPSVNLTLAGATGGCAERIALGAVAMLLVSRGARYT